jgi:tuberous sclerosis protein 2
MVLQTVKPPADLATSIYLSHLAAQVKIMTPTSLDLVFPLLFRALAFYTTPLPRLSITSPTHTVSHLEGKILEMLDSLISGPYATSCMIILKRHLDPPVVFDDNLPALIQSTIGAQRTLRNHIRRGLCNRLTRTYRSRESSTSYTTSSVPSLRSDVIERAWPKDEISSWDPGKLGRILSKSVDAWVAVELDGGNPGKDAVLEEAAGTLKDVLEELDSREENVLPEEEEASAVGKTLYRLASYVHLLKCVISLGCPVNLLNFPSRCIVKKRRRFAFTAAYFSPR